MTTQVSIFLDDSENYRYEVFAQVVTVNDGQPDSFEVLHIDVTEFAIRSEPAYVGDGFVKREIRGVPSRITFFGPEKLLASIDAAREAYARRNEPPENGGPVTLSAEEAEELGFTVDRCCYPWFAYKGPRFEPTDTIPIVTPGTR